MTPYFLKASDWQAIYDIYKTIRNDAYSAMSYIFNMIDDNNIDLAHYKKSYIIKTIPINTATGNTLFDDLEKQKINIAKTNLFKGIILIHENMFISLTHQNALEKIIDHFAEQGYDLKKCIYNWVVSKPDNMQEMYLHHLQKGTFSFDESHKVFNNILKESKEELTRIKKMTYFSSHDSHIEKHLNMLEICCQHYDKLDKKICGNYFKDFVTIFTSVLPEHLKKFEDVTQFFLKKDTDISQQKKQQLQSRKSVDTYACESFIMHIDTNYLAYQIKQEIDCVKRNLQIFYDFMENELAISNNTFVSIVKGKLEYGDSSENIIDICVVVKPGNPDLKSKIELLFEQVHYSMQSNQDINMKTLWKNINFYYDIDKSLDKKTEKPTSRPKI